MLAMWDYSKTESAKHQRIRYWARRDSLVAMRRKGRWYFSDYSNYLQSDQNGLDDDEAELWLQDKLAAMHEEGGVQ
jgi:hypothetical protein